MQSKDSRPVGCDVIGEKKCRWSKFRLIGVHRYYERNWNGLGFRLCSEENYCRWKLHNYTVVLLFSAGNHDRYKLCAIYSCHMSTKLELFLFFFPGFVWITSFSATVGRRAIGLKPPGRSHQAFHSQTSRWERPTQSQRPCQARWLNCQLWHRVSWKAVDGHPDLFRSHLPGKWNDHHYKLRNLSTLCYLKTNILVLQTLKKSRFYLSVLNHFYSFSSCPILFSSIFLA